MPSDSNYVPILDTNNEIEQILQRCRVILGTRPGEVLGDYSFGIKLEDYVFSMTFDKDELRNLIIQAINTYANPWPSKYTIDCDVNYGHDHNSRSDYAIIDIIINQKKYMGVIVS